ncbi:MAG: hypothetical protein WC924_00170 [Candidatus Gracilibacteria bacterium]
MKTIATFLLLALFLSACVTLETTKQTIDFNSYFEDGYTGLSYWSVEEVEWRVSEAPLTNFHPDQVTDFYSIGDLTFAMVSQPNTYTGLVSVRDWEKEGNIAWSGVLVKRPQTDWEIFFQVPEDDFNPVGFYLEEQQLVLDLADDNGAGSGEGALIRYVYPFAGVADELLYTWTKERCEGYYMPEIYVAGTDYCSPVIN